METIRGDAREYIYELIVERERELHELRVKAAQIETEISYLEQALHDES